MEAIRAQQPSLEETYCQKRVRAKDGLQPTLRGRVDSDWAADEETRHIHTGYMRTLNGEAISLENRRQNSMSLNTNEAEYFAASKCGQQVVLSP